MPKPTRKAKARGKVAKTTTKTVEVLGPFALKKRSDRANYDIVWRDPAKGRDVSESTSTADEAEALVKFRNHYQKYIGGPACCPHCKQPMPKENGVLLTVIRDYRETHGNGQISGGAIAHRLDHVARYVTEVLKRPDIRTGEINEKWIEAFRDWLRTTPYYVGPANNQRPKLRAISTVENSVAQLHAAIKLCGEKPGFVPLPLNELSRSPEFRADIPKLAAMFRYCLYPEGRTPKHEAQLRKGRGSLLAYLRLAVATWGRPDAILDASTAADRKQWSSDARVFHLNPVGRRQTHKYRPSVPVPECVGVWLDTLSGPVVPTWSKHSFRRMAEALELPGEGESGTKLIRRSMATLGRSRMGESNWVQGRQMLGHEKRQMSDVYAVRDPRNWGEALAATTAICMDIEALCPGAFIDQPEPAPGAAILPFRTAA